MLRGWVENTHRRKEPKIAHHPYERPKDRTFQQRRRRKSRFRKGIHCCRHRPVSKMIDQRQGGASFRTQFSINAGSFRQMHGYFTRRQRIAVPAGNQRCNKIMAIVIGPVALRPPRAPTRTRNNTLTQLNRLTIEEWLSLHRTIQASYARSHVRQRRSPALHRHFPPG